MLLEQEYIRHSLELNIFFIRLAKEHAIFAAASLPPRDNPLAYQLVALKNQFEDLLFDGVELADGILGQEALASEELVTDLTLDAETRTQFLTGIPIDKNLTKRELELSAGKKNKNLTVLAREVSELNNRAIGLLKVAVAFKKRLLKNISECKAFSFAYPSMLEHIIEETVFHIKLFERLEKKDGIDSVREVIEQEITWNEIMGDHSKFIRGYLDPSEKKLISTANSFAKEFDDLSQKALSLEANPGLLPEATRKSMEKTAKLRNFKEQGTIGILECSIKSIILPLLSDHVLREANKYMRLLRMFNSKL